MPRVSDVFGLVPLPDRRDDYHELDGCVRCGGPGGRYCRRCLDQEQSWFDLLDAEARRTQDWLDRQAGKPVRINRVDLEEMLLGVEGAGEKFPAGQTRDLPDKEYDPL